jgi:general secretion pathway protein N
VSSRKRITLLAGAGILAALVGLVTHFPARLALGWFAPAGIVAWGVDGSVWEGRAAGIIVRGADLGSLSWDAQPAGLLSLQPAWKLYLRTADGFVEGRFAASLLSDRQRISDLEAALELAALPPALVPRGVAGQARISLQRLVLESGWPTTVTGRATVANLDLPGVILTLGPFEFVFPEQEGPPVGAIRSLGGPLAVDGQVELPGPGQWQFSAELAPGENPPRELLDGLRFVGEDLGNGRRRLEMRSEP